MGANDQSHRPQQDVGCSVKLDPVTAYAEDVVSGKVLAGKYHILAARRHLNDIARQGTPEFPFRFELAKAERFWKFAELLKHYRGKWSGQHIHLEPWQKFITGSLFGWIHTGTGLRRFRTSFVQVGRKNGKTLTAAVVLLYLTFFDGEQGAAGYSVATKREQARIVFIDCQHLVQSSGLKDRIKVQVGRLSREDIAATLEALGADYSSTDGLSPSAVCVDEMHAMTNRGLLDVMETATSARQQPVLYEITTFGDNPVSPWGDQNDYANKILEGVLVDESFFTFTAHADEADDWTLPETARKANPNYGVSVNPDDLAALVLKAKGIPSAAVSYKVKHLNLCVSANAACLSIDGWRRGQNPERLSREAWLERLEHEPCFAGIDLASKIDLCALTAVFPPAPGRPQWKVIQRIWTPEDTLADRAHRDRAPYQVWVDQGWLRTTPGTRIDHNVVRETLRDWRTRFDVELVGFDPWHADKLIDELVHEDGFVETHVLAVPQTYMGMSSACLRVQAEILDANVDANGCPVTAWSVSNVVANRDGKDNLMFAKGKSRGRIDPVISLTIGLALWLRQPVERPFEGVVKNLSDFL